MTAGTPETISPAASRPAASSLWQFMALLAALWCLFFALYRALPYVRSGFVVVYSAKVDLERAGKLFPATVPEPERLVIFGNSKVLAGFVPAAFDAGVAAQGRPRVYSYNLGLPDEQHFGADLERLLQHGQRPARILLTLPPVETQRRRSVFRFLSDDDRIMQQLFPFRKLPRDLFLFAALSRKHGGLRAFYRYGEEAVRTMERDRGYYFIESKSHYEHDRLPGDLQLEADRPEQVNIRPPLDTAGAEFQHLARMADRYDLHFYFVPMYFRAHEYAEPPERNQQLAGALKKFPRFTLLGPDYWRLPNLYFSDPVHLNPEGARYYTGRLVQLVAPAL